MRTQASTPFLRSFRIGISSATIALASLLGGALSTHEAYACGGFFCGRQPVDQTAERILFEVGPDSVTMTSQISYSGDAADFAWVLPLGSVPDVNSLAVFPQKALNALDTNSGPVFNPPNDSACFIAVPQASSGPRAATTGTEDSAPPPVTVYVRTEVGPYDVAVVGSDDPSELVAWLRNAGYRITTPMEPYVRQYTAEGMKFLALKLKQSADSKDIQPFRFTLPGGAPSIPLRMTALAAEPEMSIVVFVLGGQRYEGKNWSNLTVADNQIRYNRFNYSYPVQTNWAQLVAKAVDTAGGQGWVTEFAGSSTPYAEQVNQQVTNGLFATPEDQDAAQQLLGVLQAHPYLTRLYTRLSAEEMTSDPVFGQSALGDADRSHQLSRIVDGVDQCTPDAGTSTDPCDFVTCGAAGLCRPVAAVTNVATQPVSGAAPTDTSSELPGCACLPGATARMTASPDGSPTVICQDGRLSFLNPGDREDDSVEALPDPCATYSCGAHGQCVSMNLTPTCVCDQGFVAVGGTNGDGTRQLTCVEPPTAVPLAFYQTALPVLPDSMPGGRAVAITTPVSMPEPGVTVDPTPMAGFPMPRSNPALGSTSSTSTGGCALGVPAKSAPSWGWLALGLAGTLRRRRGSRS